MAKLKHAITALAVYLVTTTAVIFKPQNDFQALSAENTSFAVDLQPWFNNRAFGLKPNDASFDGDGNSYPAAQIPPGTFAYGGFNYQFSAYNATGFDNILVKGQTIDVPRGKYFSYQMLAASESGMASGSVTAKYADGSSTDGPLLVPAWWSWPYPAGGDLVFSCYLTENETNYNRSNIFQTVNWLDSSKELVSLTFPNSSSGSSTGPGGSSVDTKLHVFALSMLPVTKVDTGSARLEIQYARSTQKWMEGTDKEQIIEVIINNVGSEFVLRNHNVRVHVESPGLETVTEGIIKRLGPGDQAIVEIGVRNRKGVKAGNPGPATVLIKGQHVSSSKYTFTATYGISQYEATYESIYSHESPNWYNNAKYGIFIHWGVYSVPGWGNVGSKEGYAEWYWWSMNQGPNNGTDTYDYHLKTYGRDIVYDDFIQNFTASAWDPKGWVDLFADAGANYFVQVSKHHEGYALFDLPENVTKRTSVALSPQRNLVKELFDASKKYQPHLHRAVYYSLPEWFHPDYKKYGFSSWPGGNATNPFTNESLPYTGYVPLKDYVADKIVPEMNTLAEMGTEIMWCDIGGPNRTTEFASAWFNKAAEQNRQVVMNARCGLPGDFDTPEYARYNGVQVRKWESNLGMDPFSYGYNRATPLASYMNARAIVTSLIDIISKNGNFLLDVGPTANGTIVDIEQQHLREAGVWIKSHAEAIFNTTYWFVTPEEGENIRFTISPDAFYIHALAKPNSTLTLSSPVPWVDGDSVTVVGGKMHGTVVPVRKLSNGSIALTVSKEVSAGDQYAWVFKIPY
jgi:alpha-L-fucosidase